MKETKLCRRVACNLVRKGHNIRAEIYTIGNITLEPTRDQSIYNTITKLFVEEIVGWIISHPNANPSCASNDIVTVLKP